MAATPSSLPAVSPVRRHPRPIRLLIPTPVRQTRPTGGDSPPGSPADSTSVRELLSDFDGGGCDEALSAERLVKLAVLGKGESTMLCLRLLFPFALECCISCHVQLSIMLSILVNTYYLHLAGMYAEIGQLVCYLVDLLRSLLGCTLLIARPCLWFDVGTRKTGPLLWQQAYVPWH